MAGPYIHDRVKDTSTTTGTGTLTLANSAPTGFRTFGSVLSNSDTVLYAIAHQSATEWETGIGTYTTSGTTLARTTVLRSSNSNNAVSFSAGTNDVFCAPIVDHADKWLHVTNTYANLAALQAGRLLFPSDGVGLIRDNGTNLYSLWGPSFPLVDPNQKSWSWVNQGSASVASVNGGICLYAGALGASIRARVCTLPSAPYKIDALVTGVTDAGTSGSASFGVCWRDSAGSGMVTVHPTPYTSSGDQYFQVRKWTNATTYSADYFQNSFTCPGHLFIRLEDDNTNRIVHLSTNGQTWTSIHSIGRTNFLTADQAGIAIYPNTTGVQMTLHSWYEH